MKKIILSCFTLICTHLISQSAIQPYTEAGEADFDVFLKILEPHGKWKKDKAEGWIYFPNSGKKEGWHPYQQGRWLYSDWGWIWQGKESFASVCYYYGQWIKFQEGWAWKPSSKWDPNQVVWRSSDQYYGWQPRGSKLSEETSFLEEIPWTKENWFFISKAKITQFLEEQDFLNADEVEALLASTKVSQHILKIPNYRDFIREGPPPKEITALTGEKIIRHSIMCLSRWDEPRPEKYEERYLFLYRPKIVQDASGVQRRIEFWVKKTGQKRDLDEISHTIMEESVRQTVEEVKKQRR